MWGRPQVTLWLVNLESAWPWAKVRGTVEVINEEGADVDIYPCRRSDETRVMYKIKPTRVNAVTTE